jgi:hypothetical protein
MRSAMQRAPSTRVAWSPCRCRIRVGTRTIGSTSRTSVACRKRLGAKVEAPIPVPHADESVSM